MLSIHVPLLPPPYHARPGRFVTKVGLRSSRSCGLQTVVVFLVAIVAAALESVARLWMRLVGG